MLRENVLWFMTLWPTYQNFWAIAPTAHPLWRPSRLSVFLSLCTSVCICVSRARRSSGGQYNRYKDVLKTTLTACGITPTEFESHAAERTSWRSLCKKGVQDFEASRVLALQEKRSRRKLGTTTTTVEFRCDICGRDCKSRIGLHSHRRRHPWPGDPSCRRLNPMSGTAYIIHERGIISSCPCWWLCNDSCYIAFSTVSWHNLHSPETFLAIVFLHDWFPPEFSSCMTDTATHGLSNFLQFSCSLNFLSFQFFLFICSRSRSILAINFSVIRQFQPVS